MPLDAPSTSMPPIPTHEGSTTPGDLATALEGLQRLPLAYDVHELTDTPGGVELPFRFLVIEAPDLPMPSFRVDRVGPATLRINAAMVGTGASIEDLHDLGEEPSMEAAMTAIARHLEALKAACWTPMG